MQRTGRVLQGLVTLLAVTHMFLGAILLLVTTGAAVLMRGYASGLLAFMVASLIVGYLALYGGRRLWSGQELGFALVIAADAGWLAIRAITLRQLFLPFQVTLALLITSAVCWALWHRSS